MHWSDLIDILRRLLFLSNRVPSAHRYATSERGSERESANGATATSASAQQRASSGRRASGRGCCRIHQASVTIARMNPLKISPLRNTKVPFWQRHSFVHFLFISQTQARPVRGTKSHGVTVTGAKLVSAAFQTNNRTPGQPSTLAGTRVCLETGDPCHAMTDTAAHRGNTWPSPSM